MVCGIGIDMVDIDEFERLIKRLGRCFIERTFTEKEVELSKQTTEAIRFLAERFATKEAVFKAVAHLTKAKTFDFRIVETLNQEDGNPYIHINDSLQQIVDEGGICNLMVSLTNEKNYSIAFVIAKGPTNR